ncbi:MAG: hypothetical protein ACI9NT_002591 [Bacteroidia bacterium]
MPQFIRLPPERLAADSFQGLLEEYASRDGTDYGEQEQSLSAKVGQLQLQLENGLLWLLYDTEADTWDLLPADQAKPLLED